jgi:predicted transcriptional regulator of viral defense system
MNDSIRPPDMQAWLRQRQSMGQYTFSLEDARAYAQGNAIAAKRALHRLSAKGRIVSVYRGFYVIVPYEYSAKGIVPAEWFIDGLFTHIGVPYYTGLLTAAAMHGAAHQQPQEYQVVVPKPMRPILIRGIRLRFFVRRRHEKAIVEKRKTPTGYLRVSDASTTALDLVRFPRQVGGWDRLATLFEELGESITPKAFLAAAEQEAAMTVLQRTCWLLERTGHGAIADNAHAVLWQRGMQTVLLDPSSPRGSATFDTRWKIVINSVLESE